MAVSEPLYAALDWAGNGEFPQCDHRLFETPRIHE